MCEVFAQVQKKVFALWWHVNILITHDKVTTFTQTVLGLLILYFNVTDHTNKIKHSHVWKFLLINKPPFQCQMIISRYAMSFL